MEDQRELQRNEVEVLQAIYTDDLEMIKPAWKVKSLYPEFRINIYDQDVGLEKSPFNFYLTVKFTPNYPFEPPSLSIQALKGISSPQTESLRELARLKAKEFIGQEMIYMVVECLKEELTKQLASSANSFYDEMLRRKEEKEKASIKQLVKNSEMRSKLADEENRQLVVSMEKELQTLKEKKEMALKSSRLSGIKGNVVDDDSRVVQLNKPLDLLTEYGERYSIPFLIRGPLLGQEDICQNYLVFIDESEEFMGSLLEIHIQNPFYESSHGIKKLDSILRDLECVRSLRPHKNLSRLLTFQLNHQKNGKKNLIICNEYEMGTSLSSVKRKCGTLPFSAAIGYITQILEGLQFLHSHKLYHGNLSLDFIFLNEEDPAVIKFTRFHYWRKIKEYQKEHPLKVAPMEERREFWSCPIIYSAEDTLELPFKVMQKVDVWDFGRLVCQLLFGEKVLERHEAFAESIPELSSIPEALRLVICRCFKKNMDEYPNVAELLRELQQTDFTFFSISNNSLSLNNSEYRNYEVDNAPLHPPRSTESRYRSDFEEVEFLGRGGFGEVVKARNRLDNRMYAIKKIRINPADTEYNKKIMREVVTLSRLHHDYVVRYYQAWLEVGTVLSSERQSQKSSSSEESIEYSTIGTEESLPLEEDNNPLQDDWMSTELSSFSQTQNATQTPKKVGGNVLFRYQNSNSSDEDNEDESESDSESEENNNKSTENEGLNAKPNNLETRKQHILYIQMEYCTHKTLRGTIDEGLKEKEAWRYLRQIVEGLVHIHEQGMIHRDLKPSNIFIDSNGNIKIGDFGLAVIGDVKSSNFNATTPSSLHGGNTLSNDSNSSNHNNSMTLDIGTPFYMSPEQMRGVKYSQKVDLYSLGIIFFEMCFPFQTSMERMVILGELRESGKFPDSFDSARENERKLIRWLLSKDPKDRPNSIELLQSNLLPVQLDDSHIEEAIRTVANMNTPYYSKLMKVLYGQEVDRQKDLIFDLSSYQSLVNESAAVDYYLKVGCVRESLTSIFKRHCALEVPSPLLTPKSSIFGEHRNSVKLLDSTGLLLELPFNLTHSFARFVGRNNISNMRRFSFDRVYRAGQTGGQPKVIFECDFDIIHSKKVGMYPEAEVFKVVCEVLDSFPLLLSSDYMFKVNHSQILDVILLACDISPTQNIREKIYQMFSQVGIIPWIKIQNVLVLDLRLSYRTIEMLSKFYNIEGTLDEVEHELKGIVGPSTNSKFKNAIAQLRDLEKMLHYLGIQRRIIYRPCLTYGGSYYCGIIFQTFLATKGNTTDVLAAGGRYDELILSFRPPSFDSNGSSGSARKDIFGVGVNFAINKLILFYGPESSTRIQLRQTEVLVCSFTRGLQAEKLSIASLLWNVGVKAEIYCDESGNSPMDEIVGFCKGKDIPWMIIVKDKALRNASGSIKLRSVEKRFECDLNKDDLSETLIGLLSGFLAISNSGIQKLKKEPSYERVSSSVSGSNELLNVNSASASSILNSVNINVNILSSSSLAQRQKLKYNQKNMIIEKAQKIIIPVAKHIMDPSKIVEVIAFDVDKDCLRRIGSSSILEDEFYRKCLESFSHLRDVIDRYRDLVRSIVESKRPSFIFLYSYREDHLEMVVL